MNDSRVQAFRRKTNFFQTGTVIRPAFIIEVKVNGKWAPLGREGGILKYDTAAKRDAEMEELKTVLMS